MAARKPGPKSTRKKRKPYEKPTLTQLTAEAAIAALETKGIPGDEQVEKLVQAIKSRMKSQ